jgi:hypothetical protein
MRKSLVSIVTFTIMIGVLALSPVAFAGEKEMKMAKKGMGKYFDKHQGGDNIDAAIQRGEKIFNDIGCAGCHPRGGTIGGTAVTSTGMKMPVPIPELKGSALHMPRTATPKGILVNLGQMNDL